MECQNFEKQVASFLRKDEDARLDKGLQQHVHACSKCREKYAGILNYNMPEQAVPEPLKMHASDPTKEEAPDQLSDPVEFKDAPITFTLYSDGREEAIKVVEPEMDVPLPEGGRLVVAENEATWCDVRYVFNPKSDRPYELHFSVLMGIIYAVEHQVAFGIPLEEDKDLLSRYKMKIAARGGVKAWIEMTQGKARLFIKYQGKIQ